MVATRLTPPHRPVPGGLLGMLALLAVIESSVARGGLDLATLATWNYGHAGRAARREATRAAILCLGDSQIMYGIAPTILERRLGKPAYNLALIGGQVPAAYFLLRRALESGARPAAVLVNAKANALGVRPQARVAEPLWQLLDLREGLDLALALREADLFASMAAAQLLPSWRARWQIRSRVLAAVGGQRPDDRESLSPPIRNSRINRGGLILPRNPAVREHIEPREHPIYYPDRWGCHPINAHYLRRLFDLAATHDIPVFWLLPPIVPEAQARRETLGLDARHTRLVRAMQARAPHVVVIDGRHSGFPHTTFIDSCHLDRRGAAVFSDAVATVLAHHLAEPMAGPRWVELPAYRDRPIDAPLEDIDQSRMALGDLGSGRRR